MAIFEFTTQVEADDIPDPKHIWHDLDIFRVYTGTDIPVIPNQSRTIEPWQFRDRFTQAELESMQEKAKTDPQANLLLLYTYTATQGIDLDSQTVINGLAYWVSVGCLASNRVAEIRA